MQIEKRLEELGITLPAAATPVANYVTTVQTGNLVFTSGHGPGTGEGKIYKSQLGTDAEIEGWVSVGTTGGNQPHRHAQTGARRFRSGPADCEGGRVCQFRADVHGSACCR